MTPPIKHYKHALYPHGCVTQWYGENYELYRNLNIGLEKGHNGIDIVAAWGTPLYAIEDGIVADVKDDPKGFGKHIRWFHDCGNGRLREWIYGHNSINLVKVGDKITNGQPIALMGNTGFVVSGPTPYWKHNPYAGTHVHVGLRILKLDPNGWEYTQNGPRIKVLDVDNGSRGSIDPSEYIKEAIIDEVSTQLTSIELTLQSILNSAKSLFKIQ